MYASEIVLSTAIDLVAEFRLEYRQWQKRQNLKRNRWASALGRQRMIVFLKRWRERNRWLRLPRLLSAQLEPHATEQRWAEFRSARGRKSARKWRRKPLDLFGAAGTVRNLMRSCCSL